VKDECKVLFAVAVLALLGSIVSAGPVAHIMVICDAFTPGDEISVWITAVNPTHEFEIDVYLSAATEDTTLYLSASGWGIEEVPFIAGYTMPQFGEPLTLKLASITAGELPSPAGQRCRLRLWLTPSNVPEMVYSEDEAVFSTAAEGFVAVPSGRFVMGTGNKDEWYMEIEVPHNVCLNSFFIRRHETTNEEFADFMNDAGGQVDEFGCFRGSDGELWALGNLEVELTDERFRAVAGYERHPAKIRRGGARAYASFNGCELPTEAQWEYAARAFATGDYSWGDEASCEFGNIAIGDLQTCNGDTLPVGSYPANDFGLHDVSGNVSEMCSDWFDRDISNGLPWGTSYYQWCYDSFPDGIVDPEGPPGPPPGSEVTEAWPFKSVRGGSCNYLDNWELCKLWARRQCTDSYEGCRLVMQLPG